MGNMATVRLSCFGIISAIEDDLRKLIINTTDTLESLPNDIKEKVIERYRRENNGKISGHENL
ncbi:hypothetical protein L6F43_002695, partial [Vibrio cholerae]|nr:hypothetical protein [Vibrio cholerae]